MRQPSSKQVDTWLDALKPSLQKLEDTYLGNKALKQLVADAFHVIQPRLKPVPGAVSSAFGALSHLLDKKPTANVLKRNVVRLLANWHFVRDGMDIPEWDGSATTTDIVILGIARRPITIFGKPAHNAVLKLKTGLCAGIITCVALNDAVLGRFLDHTAGVCRMECALEEVSGMMFRAEVSMRDGITLKVLQMDATVEQMGMLPI